MKERRKHSRRKVRLKADFYCRRKNEKYLIGSGIITNLSRAGALLKTDRFIPPGSSIHLSIKDKENEYSLHGKIIWAETRGLLKHCELGIQFVKVQKDMIHKMARANTRTSSYGNRKA